MRIPLRWRALPDWVPTWTARLLSGVWYRAHRTCIDRTCAAAGHPVERDWQMTAPTWRCRCGRQAPR